jgi:hypothetical protein
MEELKCTNDGSEKIARRDFLRNAGFVAAAGAIALTGCAPKEIVQEVTKETPLHPWPYPRIDVEVVRRLGHARYYDNDCSYGAFASIIETMRELVGFPYTQIPTDMMGFGAGGVSGWGTTCGALIGAAAAINLMTGHEVARKLVDQLLTWYSYEPFPSQVSNQYAVNHEFLVKDYKSDKELVRSVSNSPLCHISVTNWCTESGFASGSKERSERCGRLTGDVAAKAVELLNANRDGTFEAVFRLSDETTSCMTCHKKGESFQAGQFTQGKMECLDCHDPH